MLASSEWRPYLSRSMIDSGGPWGFDAAEIELSVLQYEWVCYMERVRITCIAAILIMELYTI